jgi:menaquinone-dependent protoporphyrinogen oxidase
MTILVAVATRHGSTLEIAEAIADELRDVGHTVEVRDVADGPRLDSYAAVIVGSAVYMGAWLPEAVHFIYDHQPRLKDKPVWLFSSGPLGAEDPKPTAPPTQIEALLEHSGARGHCIFVGKLDKSRLTLGERLVAKMVGAPEGDFRAWDAIRDWARQIASALPAGVVAQT